MAIRSVFSGWKEVRGISFCRARYKQLDQYFSAAADLKTLRRRERLDAIGDKGTNRGHAVDGGSRLYNVRGERLSGSAMERGALDSE